MIVVDTNVLAYLLLPTPYAAQAEAVLIKDSDWVAPQLIHSEFRKVLLGAVRRNDVAGSDADSFLARTHEVITVPETAVANGVIYVGSWTGHLYALDASDGSVLKTLATGGRQLAAPTIANGLVYVSTWESDGHVQAFGLSDAPHP
jgi:outer membrane protein assembly factor BamB